MTTNTAEARATLESSLNDRLPELLGEVHELLSGEWPDFAEFLEQDDDDYVHDTAVLFLHRLLDIAEQGPSRSDTSSQDGDQTVRVVFEQIGRRQWQLGNDLTRLLTAYQVGVRAAWRHVSATALAIDVPPDVLAALAEAVFDFVNDLSSASARGYVLEQSRDSAARERSREELAELLLSGRSGMQAIRTAATRARWTLPSTGAVVLVDRDNDVAMHLLTHLDTRLLPIRRDGLGGAVIPDTAGAGRREQLARLLRGADAVVGSSVPLENLPSSLGIAQIAARLKKQGVLVGDPVFADEHLDTIIVYREERLLAFLRAQLLEPLADLPAGSRERLVETLISWLRHMGDRAAIAEELHIHPQTVRYRVGQLRNRFGEQLDSPRSRARLFLALAWPFP